MLYIYVRETGQKIPLTTYIYILIDPGNQEIGCFLSTVVESDIEF